MHGFARSEFAHPSQLLSSTLKNCRSVLSELSQPALIDELYVALEQHLYRIKSSLLKNDLNHNIGTYFFCVCLVVLLKKMSVNCAKLGALRVLTELRWCY